LMTWRPFSPRRCGSVARPARPGPCRNATPRLSGTSRSASATPRGRPRRTRAGPSPGRPGSERFLRGELAFRDQFEKSFELARHGSTSSTGQGVRPPRPRRSRPAPVPGERRALGLRPRLRPRSRPERRPRPGSSFLRFLRPRPFGRPDCGRRRPCVDALIRATRRRGRGPSGSCRRDHCIARAGREGCAGRRTWNDLETARPSPDDRAASSRGHLPADARRPS